MIDSISKIPGWESGLLGKAKEQSWSEMNDFAHTGFLQIQNRFNGDTIQSSYRYEDINTTLQFIGAISILNAIAMAALANNISAAESFLELAKWFNRASQA